MTTERERIAELFIKLYEGSPWIDVNIRETLEPLSADQASRRVLPGTNTIWEIVNHLISWRQTVLQRIGGEMAPSPDNNYFEPVKETSDSAWQQTLRALEESQVDWLRTLETFNESDFDKVHAGNLMNYYEHIHGILQHDAYHLGQIRMLLSSIRIQDRNIR